MIKAAIIAGNHADLPRLVQLLYAHPDVELVSYVDTENTGTHLADIYPALMGETELRVSDTFVPEDADVVFVAAEPGVAKKVIDEYALPDDLRIIDMTGDFSLPAEDNDFVQGIPELNRKALVRGATRASMPDAATMAIAVALLPMAKNLMLNAPINAHIAANNVSAEPGTMTGKSLDADTAKALTSAMTALQNSFDAPISGVSFTGDIPSGLTALTTPTTATGLDELKRIYDEFYDDHSFTYVVDSLPDVSDVRGTNKCFIFLEKENDTLVVTTVIDTDMKGGAGNAVHVMNLLFGLIEKAGL